MDDHRKRLLIGIGIIVVTVLLLGLLLFSLFRPKKPDNNVNRSTEVSSFYSPITRNEDKLTVNYGGEANPNRDAVKQRFRIFRPNSLPMSQNARALVTSVLPEALSSIVTPTYPNTYVHIEPRSVQCDGKENCSMHVYIDSPESYYYFKIISLENGIPDYEIKQIPWEGVQ